MKCVFQDKGALVCTLFVILLTLVGCYTVPGTGRSALSFVSDEQMIALSQQSFDELKGQERVSTDPRYTSMVRRIGNRVAEAARDDIPNADWEFVVFDDPTMINAFAMPGGKVGVYTGLFQVADSEDELAAVIGHEVAHVGAKHANERLSRQLLIAGIGTGLAIGTSDMDDTQRQIVMQAFGVGSQFGAILPHSRMQELEADYLGLKYAAYAGYDPRAAITLWEAMGQSAGPKPPEWMSTHPSDGTRIARLEQAMPEALAIYESSPFRTTP